MIVSRNTMLRIHALLTEIADPINFPVLDRRYVNEIAGEVAGYIGEETQPPSPAIDDVLDKIQALITQHERMGDRGVGAIIALVVLRNQITGGAGPQSIGCEHDAHQQSLDCGEGRCEL